MELMLASKISFIKTAVNRNLRKRKKEGQQNTIIGEIIRELHVAIDCFQQNIENIIEEEISIPGK